jgi:hypothetical protein
VILTARESVPPYAHLSEDRLVSESPRKEISRVVKKLVQQKPREETYKEEIEKTCWFAMCTTCVRTAEKNCIYNAMVGVSKCTLLLQHTESRKYVHFKKPSVSVHSP